MNILVLDYLILVYLAFFGFAFGLLGSNFQSRFFGIVGILLAVAQLVRIMA